MKSFESRKGYFERIFLRIFVLVGFGRGFGGFFGVLLLPSENSSGSSSSVWACLREIDVLLAVHSHCERRNVHHLSSHSDVSLANEDSGVVDGFGETDLPDLGLESSLQKVLDLQTQNVIELVLRVIQHSQSMQTSEDGISLKEATRILLVEGEELSGSLSDLGDDHLHSPHLSLVLESEFSDQFQLRIKSLLFEGSSRSARGFSEVSDGQIGRAHV